MKTIFEIPVFLTEPARPGEGSARKADGHLIIINNNRQYLEIQIEGLGSQFINEDDLAKVAKS